MRKDLKTDLFDVIYFFAPDRIAREVVIQTIIIEEILKHRKRLVINGKDYEKNPENHFILLKYDPDVGSICDKKIVKLQTQE